jgi:hypothetical protein
MASLTNRNSSPPSRGVSSVSARDNGTWSTPASPTRAIGTNQSARQRRRNGANAAKVALCASVRSSERLLNLKPRALGTATAPSVMKPPAAPWAPSKLDTLSR